MPVQITIKKDPSSDRVVLDPNPLEAVISADRDADGRFRIAVKASENLQERPGPDKSVTFDFLNENSKKIFEAPAIPSPFKLKPGETLTLTLKQPGPDVRPIAKRAAGEQRFRLDGQGHPNRQFTLGASFNMISPPRVSGHGHEDLHMEC